MPGSMRRVWALTHQAEAQYSAVEWTRPKVAVGSVVAPAPRPRPASRLKSAARDVSFLGSYSRCRRYVSVLPKNITTRCLGSVQKGRFSSLKLTFSSRLASLLKWKTIDTAINTIVVYFRLVIVVHTDASIDTRARKND